MTTYLSAQPPTPSDPRHHLLVALDDDGRTFGFISGVEMTHPDKGTEMFLYELAVAEDARRQGIGLALTTSLADLARSQGCYGMWVGVDTDNAAAHATYCAAGGNKPEPCDVITWTFCQNLISQTGGRSLSRYSPQQGSLSERSRGMMTLGPHVPAELTPGSSDRATRFAGAHRRRRGWRSHASRRVRGLRPGTAIRLA